MDTPRISPESLPINDHAMMAAIANGDRSAFEQMYEKYSPFVYAVCRRMMRDTASADDLLADVFLEVWNKSDRFDANRGSLFTYLATLTRSRAIDRLRSQRHHVARDFNATTEPVAPTLELDANVTHSEQHERIQRALLQLAPEQRMAIDLAFFDGLSHSEVAQRLNKPLGTVKSHIRQGLIQMRDALRISFGKDAG